MIVVFVMNAEAITTHGETNDAVVKLGCFVITHKGVLGYKG